MDKEVKINYGLLSDSIEKQLNEQCLTLGDKENFINELYNSLLMVQFHLMTESQYKHCLRKLHKIIMDNIGLLEKE